MSGGYINGESDATTDQQTVTKPKEVSEDAPCGSDKVTAKIPSTTTEAV